ncbi:hypothetical protein CN080_11845 [Sinorhizobium meliloti]|nr:hypothetical protein CN080_11845 [Sinorhizobium meliloti]
MMEIGDKSFQLRYVGSRFDGARLPLDVLADLPAFRDLLVAFAKDNWRLSHADRQRLPKGFDHSISFDLVAIEEGSAMPRLDWSRQTAQDFLPGFSDELGEIVDSSFHHIIKLIDDAAHDRFPKSMSSEHIRALNKLGAGLRQGEKIEFLGSEGQDGNVVYLDTHRRKSLITHVRETYQIRVDGLGTLQGLHIDGQISVLTEEYGEIRLSIDPDRIINEFDGNTGSDIQFSVKIELDNKDNFRGVVEVYDVDLIDAELLDNLMKCRSRLTELRNLQDGWLNGSGSSPTENAASTAERFIRKRPAYSREFGIFPTPAGGIVLELEVDGWDYSVEFSSEGSVEMYGIEVGGPEELEPQYFEGINPEFLNFFDRRVGR